MDKDLDFPTSSPIFMFFSFLFFLRNCHSISSLMATSLLLLLFGFFVQRIEFRPRTMLGICFTTQVHYSPLLINLRGRVSLRSCPVCPQTCSLSASASRVAGSQVCNTTPFFVVVYETGMCHHVQVCLAFVNQF